MKKTNRFWVPILVAVITFGSLFTFAGRSNFSRFGTQHANCHAGNIQNECRRGSDARYNNFGAHNFSDTSKLPAATADTTKH